MTTREANALKKIFAKRLTLLLNESNMEQVDLSELLGLERSAVNKWIKAKCLPRMGTIEKIASIFGVKKSFLLEENAVEERSYYLNKDAAQLAQEIYENPGLRILLDASRSLTVDDINAVVDIVKRMSRQGKEMQ